ncbi:hypothetical protein B0H19DRAFT_1073607 [Mycena capillaripes]|nr:hypothetical protein B0H19DRAFT_1073607 [Mycena capillaripes]
MVPESPPPALVSNTPASTTAVSTTPTATEPAPGSTTPGSTTTQEEPAEDYATAGEGFEYAGGGLPVFQSRRRQLWWNWFGGGGLDVPEDAADGVEDKGKGKKPVKERLILSSNRREPPWAKAVNPKAKQTAKKTSATEANSAGQAERKRKRVDDETCGDGPAQEKGKQSDLVAADQSRRPTRVCAPLKARAAPGSPVVKVWPGEKSIAKAKGKKLQSVYHPYSIILILQQGITRRSRFDDTNRHPSSVLIGATSFDADLACPDSP